ncbi:MAG TPA: S41 family peptidase [Thermoanaerobaculia bacterium]|nr:S41 family peptidase [Thermoanaerobaculia bacterium]
MTKRKIAFLTLSVALMVTLLAGAVFGQAAANAGPKDNIYRYLSIFSEVFDLVRSNYVEQVSSEQLLDGAFSGVTDAVDEFSYYVPPAQMPGYKNYVESEDNGVGLIVTKRFGYAYVIAPVEGSPAKKAGVERGDFIEKIDGQPTVKMSVWQIRNALRANDKPVHIQVLRGGQTKRDEFTLQPATYHPVALETKSFDGVAYIRIPFFEKGTAAQFRSALNDVRTKGVRKLIVDVRGNAGGSIDDAIAAADELLTSGLITTLEGRKVEEKRWQADRATSFDGDIEVLTDTSTASGAEIFAAALHGNNRGKLVGVTTYGKAIVQRFIPLASGGGVQMTVAHYTTPDLKPIKETGVKPDVMVDLTVQAIRDPNAKPGTEPKEDLILEKALQLFGSADSAGAKKAA